MERLDTRHRWLDILTGLGVPAKFLRNRHGRGKPRFWTILNRIYARARRTFAGRPGLRCGHTRTGSDQRRLSVQREGGHSPGRGTIGGRHFPSIGIEFASSRRRKRPSRPQKWASAARAARV
jgi:hypothetical protein